MPPDANDTTLAMTPQRILGLLREQTALFTKLESLACRQQALVAGEAIEPLLSVLADRQRVSVRLAQVASLLKPVRASWRTIRETLDVPQREEAEELVASTEASLKRLIDGDERDAHILSARKRRVANVLSGLTHTGRAVDAYQRRKQTIRRVDLVSEDA